MMKPTDHPWKPPAERLALEPYVGECFHPARSRGQADLYALTGEAAGWALKDFSRRPLWMRLLATRRVLKREARALSKLGEMEGVPRLGGIVGRDGLVMERLDADRLPHRRHGIPSLELFRRLDRLVAEMHGRGWAHGDLRRKNILMDAEDRPYLIDFATSWHAGPDSGVLRRWLFERWKLVDRVTLARIKQAYRPDDLTAAEKALLAHQPRHLLLGRWLKKNVYRPFKPRHRRRLWNRLKSFFRP